jgi:hypothetical protein
LQPYKYVLMDILDNRRFQLCGGGALLCSWFLTSYICCGTISHWDQSCAGRYRNMFDLRDPYQSDENPVSDSFVVSVRHWLACHCTIAPRISAEALQVPFTCPCIPFCALLRLLLFCSSIPTPLFTPLLCPLRRNLDIAFTAREECCWQYANILVEQHGDWAIAQVGAYLFSTVMVFGAMSLAPNKRIPIITEYGSRSLTNYICKCPCVGCCLPRDCNCSVLHRPCCSNLLLWIHGLIHRHQQRLDTGCFHDHHNSPKMCVDCCAMQLVVLLMAVLTSLLLMTPWASFAVEWLINPPLGE